MKKIKFLCSGRGVAFDTGLARKYGIPVAVIYNSMGMGYDFFKAPLEELEAIFDYLSKKEIKKAIKILKEIEVNHE